VSLGDDGRDLDYRFDARAEDSGVPALIGRAGRSGNRLSRSLDPAKLAGGHLRRAGPFGVMQRLKLSQKEPGHERGHQLARHRGDLFLRDPPLRAHDLDQP
jgi:hypothetical protein